MEASRGLDAGRLQRHFEPVPGVFRVKASLRRKVDFRQHNLVGPGPDPSGCDLVMCRNVLIYFEEPVRFEVTGRLRRAVGAGGFIGVGACERVEGGAMERGWYECGPVAAQGGER
jgi:chemotaxis protein methyltransferase CheR